MKIAIVGGGSAYAPGLVAAFAERAEAFDDAELFLMDIAEAELGIVARLSKRLLERTTLTVRASTNRLEAIEGADYVLTTFREGGLDARERDETVPLAHGVVGQETIGPGGFFFATRTIPVIREVTKEIRSWAPDATLVNYANPTQIVAEAVQRHTDVPIVAICDQADDDRVHIARALDLDPHDVELEAYGVNHATWSSRVVIQGEEGVARMIAETDRVLVRDDVSPRTKRQFELTRRFGQVPNSYLQYTYYPEETLAEARAASRTRAATIRASLPDDYAHFAEQTRAEVPLLTRGRGGSVFGDFAVRVLETFATGRSARLILNVRNQDRAVPDLDEDRIVEVPSLVAGGVVRPEPQTQLASDRSGLIRMLADYQVAAADAIWSDDEGAWPRALASNPLVGSLDLADALLRDRATAGA